jgi:hypothetical protein
LELDKEETETNNEVLVGTPNDTTESSNGFNFSLDNVNE